MKNITEILIILLFGAILFTGAASAYTYEFDTSHLLHIEGDTTNYSLTGTNLTLSVNLTGFSGDNITRFEITTTVTDSDDQPIESLGYDYQTGIRAALKDPIVGKPWCFIMTDISNSQGIDSDCQVFLINITGIPANTEPVTINVNIAAGAGNTDSVIDTIELDVTICDYLIGEESDNTKSDYEGDDSWSYTNKSNVTQIIRFGPGLGDGILTLTTDLEVPTIFRTADESLYAYTLSLTPDGTNVTATILKLDGGDWIPASETTEIIIDPVEDTITLTIAEEDRTAEQLKLVFTGKTWGDVTDRDGVNLIKLADIDLLSQEIISGMSGTQVTSNRYIYGDVYTDGQLTVDDTLLIFKFLRGVIDSQGEPIDI